MYDRSILDLFLPGNKKRIQYIWHMITKKNQMGRELKKEQSDQQYQWPERRNMPNPGQEAGEDNASGKVPHTQGYFGCRQDAHACSHGPGKVQASSYEAHGKDPADT